MSGPSYVRPALRRQLLEGETPKWLQRHSRRRYIVSAVIATPYWVKRGDFVELEKLKRHLTNTTGVRHSLDHRVPLNHRNVCGLNVPWNMQVMTDLANAKKGNCWYDEPDSLLPVHEQFRLFA